LKKRVMSSFHVLLLTWVLGQQPIPAVASDGVASFSPRRGGSSSGPAVSLEASIFACDAAGACRVFRLLTRDERRAALLYLGNWWSHPTRRHTYDRVSYRLARHANGVWEVRETLFQWSVMSRGYTCFDHEEPQSFGYFVLMIQELSSRTRLNRSSVSSCFDWHLRRRP
jgi:hypothetical protein